MNQSNIFDIINENNSFDSGNNAKPKQDNQGDRKNPKEQKGIRIVKKGDNRNDHQQFRHDNQGHQNAPYQKDGNNQSASNGQNGLNGQNSQNAQNGTDRQNEKNSQKNGYENSDRRNDSPETNSDKRGSYAGKDETRPHSDNNAEKTDKKAIEKDRAILRDMDAMAASFLASARENTTNDARDEKPGAAESINNEPLPTEKGNKYDKGSSSENALSEDRQTPAVVTENSSDTTKDTARDMPSLGVRTDLKTAARLLRVTEKELIDATSLLNEYLTVTKENGEFMFNRFDIERLEQFFDAMENRKGLSDEMMLNYAEVNFTKPYKNSMEEIATLPTHLEDMLRGIMTKYTLDIKNSLSPLINNMAEYMRMTGETLRQQEAMIEGGKQLLEEQQRTISDLSRRLSESSGEIEKLRDIAEELSSQSTEQDSTMKDIISQMKASQGSTIKAINTLSDSFKEAYSGESAAPDERSEELLELLKEVSKRQEESQKTLSSVTDTLEGFEASGVNEEELASVIEENDGLKAKVAEYEEKLKESDDASAKAAEYKMKLETAIKNLAKESDEKTKLISALQSQLREQDRDKASYMPPQQRASQAAPQAMPQGVRSSSPMRRGFQGAEQYYDDEPQYRPEQNVSRQRGSAFNDEQYDDDYNDGGNGNGPTVTINYGGNQSNVNNALRNAARSEEQPQKKRGLFGRRH